MRVSIGWKSIAWSAAAVLLAITAGTGTRAAGRSLAVSGAGQAPPAAGQGTTATGASADGLWTLVSTRDSAVQPQERVIDGPHAVVSLSKPALDALLQRAPLEQAGRTAFSDVIVTLPMPDGSFARFRVEESPMLAAELAAAFPEFRTYHGQGIDNPTATTRFGWTAAGFHAIVLSDSGSVYIDVYVPGDLQRYVAYRRGALQSPAPFVCLVGGDDDGRSLRPENEFPLSHGGTKRTYRLALAATGEYTVAAGGTKELALARMTATMNRVNGIYERDLAVRMTLSAGTPGDPTALIYINGATDPYTNDDGVALLDENQATVDAVVGSANYDVGHVFSTGGGGVASLRSPCNAFSKARGVTGSSSPTGDAFDVDYVAHEMGHQFGGNHTFNGTSSACGGGNRAASHAYEVGSASTIQGYAGICGVENLQRNSDDYFHAESLDEMTAFLTSGGGATCGTASATGNTPPAVSAGGSYTIPHGTPFALTATGSDADGDSLTYTWEEFDLGTASSSVVTASTDDGTRPLFRSYAGSASPSRTFPSLTYILNHANVPPATYTCGGGTCLTGEVLPSTNRTMTFQVTARDNRSGGGGIATSAAAITVTTAAGPFRVTAPNTAGTVPGSSSLTVTWNVAGTSAAPVSAATVNIRYSSDGGLTYPTLLAAGTPNDGSQAVTVPNAATTSARIKVEAAGNVFFDVSDTNFTVTAASFTDSPLQTGVTPIRKVHLDELRTRIDALRVRFGLPGYEWTPATLTAGVTVIGAAQITEMRAALNAAYGAAGRSLPAYTDDPLSAGVTVIRAVHVEELRAAVIALE